MILRRNSRSNFAIFYLLMPPPGFEPGTFRLRIGGFTNRPLGQLMITILHSVYRFKDKMAFSSDYFGGLRSYTETPLCQKNGFNHIMSIHAVAISALMRFWVNEWRQFLSSRLFYMVFFSRNPNIP